MAVTGTKTIRVICTEALRKAGIVAVYEDADAYDEANALAELNEMLKDWQNEQGSVWTLTSGSLTLTTASSYTLSPIRPMAIHNARFKRSGTELPMVALTREEYDRLPNKAATGTPTQFYYDRQKEAAKLYIWPSLATAAGETIEYTYTREIEDATDLGGTLDVPAEMWSCVVYNLAARLLETYNLSKPNITGRAQLLFDRAFGFDQEGSVFFGCDE